MVKVDGELPAELVVLDLDRVDRWVVEAPKTKKYLVSKIIAKDGAAETVRKHAREEYWKRH